jgi:hypothetical protein
MADITSIAGASEEALSLKNLLEQTLTVIEDRYTYHGVSLPTRRYWSINEEVIDCEQLVVTFQQLYIGVPGDEATRPQKQDSPRSAVLKATIARPIPTTNGRGLVPTEARIQQGSEISAVDAWVLLDCISMLDQWQITGSFGIGVIATVDTDPPQGGFQTVTATFTIAVP